jgi:glucose-1-phosphate adenylyltransferase
MWHRAVNSPLTEVWGPNSILDSVVSRRSAIFDARVVRSVISKGVRIEASAEIESSVLLPGVRVGRGARIGRAVIDEYVEIPDGAEMGYDLDMDRRRFQVSRDGIVAIPSEATIAPDAVWETSATAIRKCQA